MRALFGRHQPPLAQQAAVRQVLAGTLSSLQEDPGLRVAATTTRSSHVYSGADLVVQRFLRPPTGPNDPGSLQLAPVSINARRALNRGRGHPGSI